jgi:hypothetical protein
MLWLGAENFYTGNSKGISRTDSPVSFWYVIAMQLFAATGFFYRAYVQVRTRRGSMSSQESNDA